MGHPKPLISPPTPYKSFKSSAAAYASAHWDQPRCSRLHGAATGVWNRGSIDSFRKRMLPIMGVTPSPTSRTHVCPKKSSMGGQHRVLQVGGTGSPRRIGARRDGGVYRRPPHPTHANAPEQKLSFKFKHLFLSFVLRCLGLLLVSSLAVVSEMFVVLILEPLGVEFELPSGPSDLPKP